MIKIIFAPILFFQIASVHKIISKLNERNISFTINSPSNDSIPNFKLLNLKNEEVNFYDLRSKKYVLISFWELPCQSCKEESKQLNQVFSKYNKYINFISVFNSNDINNWKSDVGKLKIKGVILLDPKSTARKYFDLKHESEFILLNRDFQLLEKSENVDELRKRLEDYYFIYDPLIIKHLQ